MSVWLVKRTRDPLETLERMLTKTTLVTQRVGHEHIMDIGDKIVDATRVDDQGEKDKVTQGAIEACEARATRELRAALKRLRHEKDEERQRALDKQQWYFDRLVARISHQRDQAEAERMREFRKKIQEEKEEALRQQQEDHEKMKQKAVQQACDVLRTQLRNEFAVEKQRAVADALRKANESFKQKELDIIERTRQECEEKANKDAERVKKYEKELSHKEQVERDFRALQDDYRKFMDHTDGIFHSDYLMHLRYLGMRLANKEISAVTYEDIEPLPKL
ncbi:unnamed protein product [Candidula unifasciata]|uniref:Uncharacterized protein n=1 Tax=Candidula unifasciata TaxID=100452 RepID=A0A8S3ZWG5_9EUPU|nr:unnamed protein product [Candidula unifasciata]